MPFIWHPPCHSVLGTIPTIRPEQSIHSSTCVAIQSTRHFWSRPQLKYNAFVTHFGRDTIGCRQQLHAFSVFPPSSSFLPSYYDSSTSDLISNRSITQAILSFISLSSFFTPIPPSSRLHIPLFHPPVSFFLVFQHPFLFILSCSSFFQTQTKRAFHNSVALGIRNCYINFAMLRCGVIISNRVDGFREAFRFR